VPPKRSCASFRIGNGSNRDTALPGAHHGCATPPVATMIASASTSLVGHVPLLKRDDRLGELHANVITLFGGACPSSVNRLIERFAAAFDPGCSAIDVSGAMQYPCKANASCSPWNRGAGQLSASNSSASRRLVAVCARSGGRRA
jgi:hypothetical protein